jgi:hypothetical protein
MLPKWMVIHVRDNGPWSRGLSSVSLPMHTNIESLLTPLKAGAYEYDDTVSIKLNDAISSFTFKATGASGISDTAGPFVYHPFSEVQSNSSPSNLLLSIYPNPSSSNTSITITAATAKQVTIVDVLGRPFDLFHIKGSNEWDAKNLLPGMYFAHAIGDNMSVTRCFTVQ